MPGSAEHERPRHPQPRPVAAEHRRGPPADPVTVDPHVLVGREGGEHLVALVLGELVERQLVVVAQERRPAAVARRDRQLADQVLERRGLAAGQREPQPLVDEEGELEVQGVAVVLEERRHLFHGDVALAHEHHVAAPAHRVLAQRVQPALARRRCRRARALDLLHEERHRVHAEAGHAELEPEADGLGDLVADGRVGDVQVGLERRELVQVELARRLVPRPVLLRRAVLARRVVGPHVVVAVRRARGRRTRRRTTGARSRCG